MFQFFFNLKLRVGRLRGRKRRESKSTGKRSRNKFTISATNEPVQLQVVTTGSHYQAPGSILANQASLRMPKKTKGTPDPQTEKLKAPSGTQATLWDHFIIFCQFKMGGRMSSTFFFGSATENQAWIWGWGMWGCLPKKEFIF